MLFTIAGEDQSVLTLPLPDRIFGFHAQQSCEKLFKALLAAHAEPYPFTHELTQLIEKLELACQEFLPTLPFQITRLQSYAVQFRYEPGISLSEAQRAEIRETVEILRQHILERILAVESAQNSAGP